MSAVEQAIELFFVTVDGFEYSVLYTPREFGGRISHFEFRRWKDGEESREACPLTETGYRSHFFAPAIMDDYDTPQAGAIAAIESQQDLKKFRRYLAESLAAKAAAAQMSLF